MSFPKYYVTYCFMSPEAPGTNPFGHSSLIFSIQKNENAPVEVLDCIGYYSQPTTTTNFFVAGVKKLMNLNVDFQDGHGIMKQEKFRDLDGNGLYGLSFEVNESTFEKMQNDYLLMLKTQDDVIEELNKELRDKGIKPNGQTRFLAEKQKALAENRPSRLNPFHITMKLTMQGFNDGNSFTCKNFALNFLKNYNLLSEELEKQLLGNLATRSIPRFYSLYLPPIRLISTGAPTEIVYSKRSNQVFSNREWGHNSLFWGTKVHKPEDQVKEEDVHYSDLKIIMNRIKDTELELIQKIDVLKRKTPSSDQNDIKELKIHLEDVQNLSHLFKNGNSNQIEEVFKAKLIQANEILEAADNRLNDRDVNYPLLLKMYDEAHTYHPVVALLFLIFTAPFILMVKLAYTSYRFFNAQGKTEEDAPEETLELSAAV